LTGISVNQTDMFRFFSDTLRIFAEDFIPILGFLKTRTLPFLDLDKILFSEESLALSILHKIHKN